VIPGWIAGYAPNGAPWRPAGSWGVFASHIGGYMHRWIVQTPWGTVRLHRILRADAGWDLHDYPFDFTSLILRGGYTEVRERDDEDGPVYVARMFTAGRVVRRQAADLHRITAVLPGTLTLVVSGPRVRKWGFLTRLGWVPHDAYQGQA